MQSGQGARAWGRVVVVGSLNADLTVYTSRLPRPGETVHGNGFTVSPGGKSANQAVAAGLLGCSVSLVGAIGNDDHGEMLIASAESAGVDVEYVRTSREPTGVAIITVDSGGENTIVISAGANGTLSPADVAAAAEAFEDAAVLCLCLEVGMDTVLAAAQAGRDAGATVLLNLSPYADVPEALLDITDILLVNAHEAALLLGSARAIPGHDAGGAEWEEVRIGLEERGIRQAVITLGAKGSVVLDSLAGKGSQVTRIATTKVKAVDTTGAGDAFMGAVAVRLAAGDALADAAAFASVAAALATTRKGTQAAYANAADVARLLGA